MPDPNPRRRLLDELEAERRRPIPPPADPPGVGRARMRELLDDFDDEGTDL
jgi:hypothetical protein